jgi:hypothetical protein
VTIRPSLNGELDVGMKVVEVVRKSFTFLGFMRPGNDRVFKVTESANRPAGRPAECDFLKVLHEEVGDHRWQR